MGEEGRRDYSADEVIAARIVLTELAHIFREYWDGIVVVGGWVPYFTIPQERAAHEGTKDVDLALDAAKLRGIGYETMEDILMRELYQQDGKKPFRWERTVRVENRPVKVVIDFLAGEGNGVAHNGEIQDIQEIRASTMHGCDVAFLNPIPMTFQGQPPSGVQEEVTVNVASIETFLVMKALALHNRRGDDGRKDAYDIYYCIKNYPGGLQNLAARFQSHLEHSLIQEGLTKLTAEFASTDAIGPNFIAERGEDTDEREELRRDAYEQVNALLAMIKSKGS